MIVVEGATVNLIGTEQRHLKPYVNTRWTVKSLIFGSHPASAIIVRDNLEASVYIRYLEVIPPKDSPFDYEDHVKIKKSFYHTDVYPCKAYLVGKIGRIRSYDHRNRFYWIKCETGGQGWFPAECLIPLGFKGERFFYPMEIVIYKNEKCIVTEVQRTKFKWGQLLLLNGTWVPSTDVKPTKP